MNTKKLLLAFIFISISLTIFESCSKNPRNYVKVRNDYTETLYSVNINGHDFGTLEIGSTTDYELFEDISISFSSKTRRNVVVSYKGGVSEKGKHKWTLVIRESGLVDISED